MADRPRRLLPWLHYPVVMTCAFVLFTWLRHIGAPLIVSTYVPVLLTAVIVMVLELAFPHRANWRPTTHEVRTDLEFMTVVQLAFPPLMGFLFTYALINPARELHRFHLRAAAGPGQHDELVHVLHGGEEARQGSVTLR